MKREERRSLKRAAESFEARMSFTKDEVMRMNMSAFNLGVEQALEAVAIVYGLGDKRLDKVKQKMLMLQELDFGSAVDEAKEQMSLPKVRMNREHRRANNPSKKGSVLYGQNR